MSAVLTIIAVVAGVSLFTLTMWFARRGFDLILDAISWACYFWERRL